VREVYGKQYEDNERYLTDWCWEQLCW